MGIPPDIYAKLAADRIHIQLEDSQRRVAREIALQAMMAAAERKLAATDAFLCVMRARRDARARQESSD